MRLAGKTALITGGNSGIGLATTRAFVTEGARVVISGRNSTTLAATKAELGDQVSTIESDASDVAQIAQLAEWVADTLPAGLDVLFANAGVGRFTPLGQTSEASFDEVFNTNVKGVFFLVQALLPQFKAGSSIILTGSTAPLTAAAGTAAYAASKAAVRALARVLSADLTPRGIRVNAVTPGPIATPIWSRTGAPQQMIDQTMQRISRSVPAGRMGRAEEVAGAVVFLASDDSSYMLGSEIVIDGGVAQLPGAAPAYR